MRKVSAHRFEQKLILPAFRAHRKISKINRIGFKKWFNVFWWLQGLGFLLVSIYVMFPQIYRVSLLVVAWISVLCFSFQHLKSSTRPSGEIFKMSWTQVPGKMSRTQLLAYSFWNMSIERIGNLLLEFRGLYICGRYRRIVLNKRWFCPPSEPTEKSQKSTELGSKNDLMFLYGSKV
jgi:hypothetical protein